MTLPPSSPLERFSERAADYAAGRPSYPAAVIDVLFAEIDARRPIAVVDLGAGTGISTRLLAERGAHVIAVEPNAAMRSAVPTLPNVCVRDGTAEATGIAPASIDLVTAFQAFHWFDHAAALSEIARILRPGGRAAAIYNDRDDADPLSAAYSAIVARHTFRGDATARATVAGRDAFAAWPGWARVVRHDIANSQALDAAGLHARAASTSYLPNTGPAAAALHADLDELFERFARNGQITMKMRTSVTIGHRGALAPEGPSADVRGEAPVVPADTASAAPKPAAEGFVRSLQRCWASLHAARRWVAYANSTITLFCCARASRAIAQSGSIYCNVKMYAVRAEPLRYAGRRIAR